MYNYLAHFMTLFPMIGPAPRFFLPRIAIALVCGIIIGFERELYNKAAGLKTLMLVCLGSTLFATISIYLSMTEDGTHVDKTRIIAQIVSGMGFLGAGVILQNKGSIVGMTSAANIWFTGAIGCVIGIGEFELSILLSFISIIFLVITRKLESLLNRNYEDSRPHLYHLKVECSTMDETYALLQKLIRSSKGIIKDSNVKTNAVLKEVEFRYSCSPKNQESIVKGLQEIKSIGNLHLTEKNKES